MSISLPYDDPGEMGIDPAELRLRNFIAKDAYPYQTPVALIYDSGEYFTTLEMALKAADYSGFEQRRQESARQGKLRGIGIATYIEACAMAPSVLAGQLGGCAGFYETAEVRYLADVLTRIADHPARRIAELLPWNWQPLDATCAAA